MYFCFRKPKDWKVNVKKDGRIQPKFYLAQVVVLCIFFMALAGCSEVSMLADDTETAANFAAAPAVVQGEHGTILGPPLVVPDDAPTVSIEAVFKREREPGIRYLEDTPNDGVTMLRFRITASEAPKDDMVVLVSGSCEFDYFDEGAGSSEETVRVFHVYMIIPKGQTASNIYRTSSDNPKELDIEIVDRVHRLNFAVMPLRNPLPALPIRAFLDDFMPPVEVPENYRFQLYKVGEGARIRCSSSALGMGDAIVAPELLNSHLDPLNLDPLNF